MLCRTLHQINFLADFFIEAQLRSFQADTKLCEGAGTDSATPAAAPPSHTEQLRVVRAFYRRQIVSNAWAPARRDTSYLTEDVIAFGSTMNNQGVRRGLLAAFDPWELQQIDDPNRFITQLCTAFILFSESGASPGPMHTTEYGELFDHLHLLVRYLRTYPAMADAAFRRVSSPRGGNYNQKPGWSEMISLECSNAIGLRLGVFTTQYAIATFSYRFQEERRRTLPDPYSEAFERDGKRIEFFEEDPQGIPYCWVDAAGVCYIDWYGEALGHLSSLPPEDIGSPFRRQPVSLVWSLAGFAFRDRSQVEELNRLQVFRYMQTGWVLRRTSQALEEEGEAPSEGTHQT
ncbi:hypothetical protein VTI74DRAFT_3035 [Chaetomium olivicolor]